jgi:hypothetical protein
VTLVALFPRSTGPRDLDASVPSVAMEDGLPIYSCRRHATTGDARRYRR